MNCAFYLADLGGQENLTDEYLFLHNESARYRCRPRNLASFAGAGHVTLKRSLRMHTSITASPLATHEGRTFGAGVNVAYVCISESKRATPRPEDPAALERYITAGMNYIPLSEHERSGKGASNR